MTTHTMSLSQPWFDLVRDGIKTVEGRTYTDKRKKLNIGDTIIFKNGKQSFDKKIKDLKVFSTFKEAIKNAKLKNILPGIKTYQEGVEVYLNIPNYKGQEKDFGVLNIVEPASTLGESEFGKSAGIGVLF